MAEPRTRGRKKLGHRFESRQERKSIFLLQVQLSVLTLFLYPFPHSTPTPPTPTPTVLPQELVKDHCYSPKSADGKVTARRICTLCMQLRIKLMVAWCKQNLRHYGSSFTWHRPCNNQTALHTTSVDKQQQQQQQINRSKKLTSLIQNRMRLERSKYRRKQRTALYQKRSV